MLNWIILLLLLIIVSLALALFKKKAGKGPVDFPYQSKEVLCSPAERSFLGALGKVVGNGYRVFAKVRLADIVEGGCFGLIIPPSSWPNPVITEVLH